LISIRARHAEKAFGSSEEIPSMLLFVTCPNCRNVGATTAPLPRVLVCSACGQSAIIKEGKLPWSPRAQGTLRGVREEEKRLLTIRRSSLSTAGQRPNYGDIVAVDGEIVEWLAARAEDADDHQSVTCSPSANI
jgi:ribosomal protein S27E